VITAVDTNVLVDIFGANQRFGPLSAHGLRECLGEGALVACEVVWAEAATAFANVEGFRRAMAELPVTFSSISEEAAVAASDVWRRYRARGGRRDRIASDFLVGAHALLTADRLITRDRGFYRDHFGRLKVFDPSA
jgi:predicted nucleic acid-binding protein